MVRTALRGTTARPSLRVAATVELLDSGLRTAMALPVRPGDLQPLTLEGAHFNRRGRAAVAGLGCTDYDVQSSRGHGTVCFTDDGVALRASGEVSGHQGSFTALSVSYGAVPGRAKARMMVTCCR